MSAFVTLLADRGGMMFRLANHQNRILSLMEDRSSLGIFAEAGTGKTMIALTWIYDRLISGEIENVLVICPKSLIGSWNAAIDKMALFGYSDFEIGLVKDAVTLISYNSVWIRNKSFARKKGTHKYEIRPALNHGWGAIFCDESHRLGDPTSVQTTVILRMTGLTRHRFVMSGTPDNGRYIKLYGQLKFIEPSLFADYRQFDRRYILSKDFFDNPVKYDSDALESLKKEYGAVARLKECYDMPGSTDTDIPLSLTAESRTIYTGILKKQLEDLNYDNAGTSTMKLYQVCSGFYYDSEKNPKVFPTAKIDALMEIVDGREGKVVVFALYTQSLDIICDALSKRKIPYLRFDSSVKDPVWGEFQTNPGIKVFVTQYQKGSEGIDLYAADCMVFYEPTPSAYNLEQAKARIMRKGQEKHCTYYFLYIQDTIEEKRMRNVRNGVDESRRLADEWAEEERQKWLKNEKTV